MAMRTNIFTTGSLSLLRIALALSCSAGSFALAQQKHGDEVRRELIVRDHYNVDPPHHSKDSAVKIDYNIVYVRAPHNIFIWPDVGAPTLVEPGADLMLLRPDGSTDVLVKGGEEGSVVDPYVSFDGQWVYYSFFYATHGADIFKIHVPSRKIVQLTHNGGDPAPGADGFDYGQTPDSQISLMSHVDKDVARRDVIYNTAPCPVPGGKVIFTSNRHGFVPRKGSFTSHAFQLTVMNDDGGNVETVGHLNLGCALHPVILTDGRIMFSSLENQGIRSTLHWSVWTIHPDGTNWAPLISDFGGGLPPSFHFQTQRSDGRAVVGMYYNINQAGFGSFCQLPVTAPSGVPQFGPADLTSPRNPPLEMLSGGQSIRRIHLPFTPYGISVLTPFANDEDNNSPRSNPDDPDSPMVGRLTHPCGAPDNHVFAVWAPDLDVSRDGVTGGVRRVGSDTGIYLIKAGAPVYEPGEMLLLKNDPEYHEQWPRPLVPYQRTYGVDQPQQLAWLPNDGTKSPHLPEGTPYGLVGTSSMYKRESALAGYIPEGSVTAVAAADRVGRSDVREWSHQGSDAGEYENSDIHAVRIILQEPNLRPDSTRFYSHARERLRILGEIPLRKWKNGKQPLDPDGNPDTSFLAKIPADTSFTFQTIDKQGMALNMAQTWHQVRPGEIRHNCGGCHAHSQKPTLFEETAAAKAKYEIFDLTKKTPLVTTHHADSGKQWDKNNETGLTWQESVEEVEYWHDIRPIFDRSCVACHTKGAEKPAGDLILDDDTPVFSENFMQPQGAPASYVNLAATDHGFGSVKASKYINSFQARTSPLTWKIFGRRTDRHDDAAKIQGSIMPPPDAVAGKFKGPDEKLIKVDPLSDEDRLTIVRWIDVGCPVDLNYDPQAESKQSQAYHADRTLPTLTVALPRPGEQLERLSRILIGMQDAYSGLNLDSLRIIADFPIDGVAAGENLASRFERLPDNRWQWKLKTPVEELPSGTLSVSVADGYGNVSRIVRTFRLGAEGK